MFHDQQSFTRIHLSDGVTVRLDIRWHPKPVFIADKCGNHYDIAGYIYDLYGNPIDNKTPAILEVVRFL